MYIYSKFSQKKYIKRFCTPHVIKSCYQEKNEFSTIFFFTANITQSVKKENIYLYIVIIIIIN